MKLSPQNQIIFDFLLRGGSLTALEATRPPFNTTCLHKRLSEIEATGVVIDSVWEINGTKRFKRYSYHSKPQKQPDTNWGTFIGPDLGEA